MKQIILAAILLPCFLFAQTPQPIQVRTAGSPSNQTSGDALPENYQLTLSITDKDGKPVEVSIVVASTRFTAALGEVGLQFAGSVVVEDSGSLLITYQLGWETPFPTGKDTVQFKPSTAQGSVRLKVGEDIQIISAGTRNAHLSLKKPDSSKVK